VHVGGTVVVVADRHEPRATTDLTILDVLLMRPGAWVECDLTRLPAIRAVYFANEIGNAVAEGKFLGVERVFGLIGIAGIVRQVPFAFVTHIRTVMACR